MTLGVWDWGRFVIEYDSGSLFASEERGRISLVSLLREGV